MELQAGAAQISRPQTAITMETLQIGDEWQAQKPGGLQRYYSALLEELPKTGTGYAGLVVGSDAVARETAGKVRAFATADAPLWRRFAGVRGCVGTIRRPDLAAIHFALYGLPILDKLSSWPTVVHFHGPWAHESAVGVKVGMNSRAKAWIEAQVYRRARRLITLSKTFRDVLVESYGIDESLIRVIPGGVDASLFNTRLTRQEARLALGWPADRRILLSVRRQVRRMGLEHLIDAVRDLTGSHPDLLLLLGGTGPLAPELESRIQEYGLQNHVRLLGRIADEDLPAAYRAADMTVVPTQFLEGFGLITLESLGSGTPVLVTPVGGLRETIEPFAPECVFPGTSSEEIREVLREVLNGTRTLPSEAACRGFAVENYSWSRIARMVRTVYDEALQ